MHLQFGVQIRNFPKEYSDDSVYDRIRESARQAEALQFDSVWTIDHLMLRTPIAPTSQAIPDCWITLSFIANNTSRIRIGPLVTSVLFRGPEYLSKVCSTIYQISRQRLIVGLGSGWHEDEFRSYGIEFPKPKQRLRIVEAAIHCIRKRIRNDSFGDKRSFATPPIWVGGSGEKLTLDLVAREADGCSLQGNLTAMEMKISALRNHCARYSRSPESITISKQSNVVIDSSENGIRRKLRQIIPDEYRWKFFKENNFVGTPDECFSQIVQLSKLGISYFTLNFPDLFELDSMRLFAKDVIGQFGNRISA